jgi:hypothetical protein
MRRDFCRRCGFSAHGPICRICVGTFAAGCVTSIGIGLALLLVRIAWR